MIPAATRETALRARRLARGGHKGAAIADKLGLPNAARANALAEQGRRIDFDERAKLTPAELLCVRLIDLAHLRQTEAGITRGVTSPAIDRMAGRSPGWCARTVRRRLLPSGRGIVEHSRNGHIHLTLAGHALAHVLRDVPTHILRKWGLRS